MSERVNREEELFDAGKRLSEAKARAAFLASACAGDLDLRARVESLLAAQAEAEELFLPLSPAPPIPRPPAANEEVGTDLGRYTLREKIGEGGMGVVYRAEQHEPVRRQVALKIIKLGMDTREVVARFEAERQALALMDHPNIAKVLDAGVTGSGRPFFAMELVEGIPITEFCGQKRLSLEPRLRLFISVCQAVQHAHQKGIIHRDLKPSNVLVTEGDGVPTPKVIDFGVAKALHQRLAVAAPQASPEAAAAQAAYTVLTNISRANLSVLSIALQNSLATVPDGQAKEDGRKLGRLAAEAIIQLRSADNLDLSVTAPSSPAIGRWRPTPPSFTPGVCAGLRYLTPFTMTTIAQFRQGPPPALTSVEYASDYNEVRLIGGRGSTVRTPDQTQAAKFYESLAYTDVWNAVLPTRALSLVESARLFAMSHMVISDAVASVCATKYAYGFWRPVTAIQNGALDGNEATPGDPSWTSFFDTHPHPDYPSQASQVMGALVEVLIDVYGNNSGLTIVTPVVKNGRSFLQLSALFDDVGLSPTAPAPMRGVGFTA